MLSPLAAFLKAVEEQPNRVYLRQPIQGHYHEYSWAEVHRLSRNMAYQLTQLGVKKGDRVALWSKNCAQWIMADLAIMMAGAVSVPLYPGQSKSSAQFVLDHSESKVLFLGLHDDPEEVASGIPSNVITIAFPYYKQPATNQWADLSAIQAPSEFLVDDPALDDLMTLVYTSGTTGQPKGAMHTHGGFAFAANNLVEQVGVTNQDRTLSFLPLAHVAERVILEGQSFYGWFNVSFIESLETFNDNIVSVRPTMFFAVPRLWSKFQEGVLAKLGGSEKLEKLLKIPVLNRFIKYKIRKSLGLDQANRCGCGASPMPKSLLQWFDRIGITIYEGYGMTENLCYGTRNDHGARSIGSAGKPYNRNEIKISEDGEILFKSPSLMKGYYKDPAKTQEAFIDGFYRTGDKGMIDDEGYLHITGRVKELFKTTKGKYIAPAPIEALLTSHEMIEQACVMGSGRSQPLAVLELSETARNMEKATVEAALTKYLEAVNNQVEHHERMDSLVLTQLTWTVESGLITPTLKIKRDAVESRYLEYAKEGQKGLVWGPKEQAVSSGHQAA